MNALAARIMARGVQPADFTAPPEPSGLGASARGQQVLDGHFLVGGRIVQLPQGASPWDRPMPDRALRNGMHGFEWLDHLAALGNRAARRTAQDWTAQWIARFGRGSGPGWSPALAGQRLRRWTGHALLLMSDGKAPARDDAFLRALAHHTAFVARRWDAAAPGQPRLEALTGLLLAALSLQGMAGHVPAAKAALVRECRARIDANGAIPSRNPQELLDILVLLTTAARALEDAGRMVELAITEAIEHIAITLRTLRHADGTLPRFHGADSVTEGLLDRTLAESAIRAPSRDGRAMGYGRLTGGRSTLIVDAAPPPLGPGSERAHASTLAFELVSNRRAVIVNCGAGAPFGADWERASRATASHSTLALDGLSSARMGVTRRGSAPLGYGPRTIGAELEREPSHTAFLLSHDGYVASHGLTHLRRLDLSRDGRALVGEDTLVALAPDDKHRLERVLARAGDHGIGYAIRFHLHPQARAEPDPAGTGATITLQSGEVWALRFEGPARLSLEPSVYLEAAALRPRATMQITLSAAVRGYTSQIAWTLAKTADTPLALRDIGRDDALALPPL